VIRKKSLSAAIYFTSGCMAEMTTLFSIRPKQARLLPRSFRGLSFTPIGIITSKRPIVLLDGRGRERQSRRLGSVPQSRSFLEQEKGEPPSSPMTDLFFEGAIAQKTNLALNCICLMLVAVLLYVLKFGEANELT